MLICAFDDPKGQEKYQRLLERKEQKAGEDPPVDDTSLAEDSGGRRTSADQKPKGNKRNENESGSWSSEGNRGDDEAQTGDLDTQSGNGSQTGTRAADENDRKLASEDDGKDDTV